MEESKSREFGGTVRARKTGGSGKGSGKGGSKGGNDAQELLVPMHAFGSVGHEVRDPATVLVDSTSVCHLVGQHLAIYNTERRSMQFFSRNRASLGVLGMCVAGNYKVVALCEKCAAEDKAQVSVYHVTTQRKMRTLLYPMKGDFTLCAFSADAKILVTAGVGADGETQIVYWKWAVEKVMSTAKGTFRMTRVRVNPDDSTLVTTSGPQHLRLWRATMDPLLKESPLVPGKREQDNFVDHAWLRGTGGAATSSSTSGSATASRDTTRSGAGATRGGAAGPAASSTVATRPSVTDSANETRIVAVTDSGTVLVFARLTSDDGTALFEARHTFQASIPDGPAGTQVRVETIATSRKGFCLGGTRGYFAAYEKTDDPKDPFLLLKAFSTGDEAIACLSIAPNEEHLVAYSRPSRLRRIALSNIDILPDDVDHFAPLVPRGTHTDAVTGLDVCVQMPLVVTVSADKAVRVWNYLTWACQLAYVLDEMPQTVAFHPSGLLLLVAFRERLRAYNLLMDGLKVFHPNQRDLQVKNCRAISFSNGGQFFACGAGIKVQVYATYTFEEVACFEGHVSVPIRQLTWSADDQLLASCGDDGAVYTCSLDTKGRLEDLTFVHKHTQYTSVAVAADKTCVVGAAADGYLRLVHASGEEEQHALGGDAVPTRLLLNKDNTRLYVGTNKGSVRVYDWPLGGARPAAAAAANPSGAAGAASASTTKPMPGGGGGAPPTPLNTSSTGSAPGGAPATGPTVPAGGKAGAGGAGAGAGAAAAAAAQPRGPVTFQEYAVHVAPITSLHISRDGKYLFTSSADGCVFALAIPAVNAAAAGAKPGAKTATPKASAARTSKRGKSKRTAQALFEPPDKRQFNLGVALVNQEVMEEKLADLAAMEKNLEETKSTAKYNLHLKDSEWAEKMAKQAEAMDEELVEERARYEQLQQRHEAYVRDHMEEKERTDAEHVRVMQEVENQYEHKLALELERYDALSEQVESMRQECEILLDSAEEAHKAAMKDKEAAFASQEAELRRQLDTLHANIALNKKKFKTILAEVEEEHDQEIARHKQRERERIEEVQKDTAAKGQELSQQVSNVDTLQKRLSDVTAQKEVVDNKLGEALAHNRRLEELLAHADRVILEQKKSIADKEKQILNLRAGNRTLDNFRFVLDHRINQLTQERGPITAHVDQLERHIQEMYEELVKEFQEKKATDREMSNKDLKIEGLTRETSKLRAAVREKERLIASIQADLERHVKTTEIKDLESALKDMYRTYVKNEKTGHRARVSSRSSKKTADGSAEGKDGDASAVAMNPVQANEAVQEVLRQKEYMERHAKGLKRKLNIRMSQTKAAARARLAENSSLINECNQLRKDNVRFKRKIKELETHVYLLTRDGNGAPGGDSMMAPPPSRGASRSRASMRGGTMGDTTLSHVSAPRDVSMTGTAGAQSSHGRGGASGMGRSTASSVTSFSQRSVRRMAEDPGNEAVMKMVAGGAGMSRSASARQFRSGGRKRAATARSDSGYGLYSSRSGNRSAATLPASIRPNGSASGRIVRGTTKQLDELTSVRVKMGELLSQLDDNNREMSMQRREIKRLREQVRLLATRSTHPAAPPLASAPPRPAPLHSSLPTGALLPSPATGVGMAIKGLPVSPVGSPPEGLAPIPSRDNNDAPATAPGGHGVTAPVTQ